jgi:nitrite reductase (NADH) large subunit
MARPVVAAWVGGNQSYGKPPSSTSASARQRGVTGSTAEGDILTVVDSHDEVLRYMGRFMQYYREHAKYLERTYDFVPRIGIEKLRSLLVDDAEGICAQLDIDIQAAVDAYVDPWQEAVDPVHPSQFADTLEPVSAMTGPSWEDPR